MKMGQKGFVVPLIIAIVLILAIGGVVFVTNNKVEAPVAPQIIGGDKDEHGCLGPAGYSWCAMKNKCLRVWEEKCEATSVSTSTDPVVCTADAMQCPDGSYVSRTGPKCEFAACPN